jgi:hypothetical protein
VDEPLGLVEPSREQGQQRLVRGDEPGLRGLAQLVRDAPHRRELAVRGFDVSELDEGIEALLQPFEDTLLVAGGAVEGEHELAVQALAQGVLRDQRLELAGQARVLA